MAASDHLNGEQLRLFPEPDPSPPNYYDDDYEYETGRANVLHQNLREGAARGPRIHAFPHQALEIAESGEYRTQHDTEQSNGYLNPAVRKDFEDQMGWDKPVYGTVDDSYSVEDLYGDVVMKLSHKHRPHTTVTARDSLNAWAAGDPATPTSLSDVGRGNTQWHLEDENPYDADGWRDDGEYLEAQIHAPGGRIPVEDFSEVVVPIDHHNPDETDEVADLFHNRGIKVYRQSVSHQQYLPGMGPIGPDGKPRTYDPSTRSVDHTPQDIYARRRNQRRNNL